ncbi:hypothetical protein LTR28_011669 [Elasticomyces elasticus]|nr:hypothetical protein LTR28_011669 [Elasticomyces elasticus]
MSTLQSPTSDSTIHTPSASSASDPSTADSTPAANTTSLAHTAPAAPRTYTPAQSSISLNASTQSSHSPRPSTPAPTSASYTPPPYTSYPPFYTLQPNATTRSRQLSLWSSYILSYTRSQTPRIFRLNLSTALDSSLFHNRTISRRLGERDARTVLDWMASRDGGTRVEWIGSGKGKSGAREQSACWVFWKTPAEWGDAIYNWVDATGQKGSILTLYELRQGDAVQSQEWAGMDVELLRKVLDGLVRRGRCQVFGDDHGAGVKFF